MPVMHELNETVRALLETTGLPVLMETLEAPGFPYAEWSGSLEDEHAGTVTVRCRYHGEEEACLRMLDTLCALVPEHGLLERRDGWIIYLWREAALWQRDEQDARLNTGCLKLGFAMYPPDRALECRT